MIVNDAIGMKEHSGTITACRDGWLTITDDNRDSFTWHESNKSVVPVRLGPFSWPKIGNQD